MIIICEPYCIDYEHVDVNSALINTINIAYPASRILFLGDAAHISGVEKLIKYHAPNITIEYLPINIFSRNLSSIKRLPKDYALFKNIFELSVYRKAQMIIFSSILSTGLVAIKRLNSTYKKRPIVIVPHSPLELINRRPSFRPTEILFWFRFHFLSLNSSNITYMLLGRSIEDELRQLFPKMKNRTMSIDMPYYFYESQDYVPWFDNIVRFGSFGAGHRNKGTDLFIDLARATKEIVVDNKSEFVLIGFLKDNSLKEMNLQYVTIPSSDAPLNRSDYDDYANKIDYAVYLYNENSYKLTASAAFFDAVSYLKPIITLRNPFFEYYFNKIGDIGYICESVDEIANLVKYLIENKPKDKYLEQVQNLLDGRSLINIDSAAKKIRDTMNQDVYC